MRTCMISYGFSDECKRAWPRYKCYIHSDNPRFSGLRAVVWRKRKCKRKIMESNFIHIHLRAFAFPDFLRRAFHSWHIYSISVCFQKLRELCLTEGMTITNCMLVLLAGHYCASNIFFEWLVEWICVRVYVSNKRCMCATVSGWPAIYLCYCARVGLLLVSVTWWFSVM